MKRIISLAFLTLSITVIFSSCRKELQKTNTEKINEIGVQTDDQARLFAETESVSNDVSAALEASASFSGRETTNNSVICDATLVADTSANTRSITITYNGTNCFGNRSRSGVIVVSMAAGVRWKTAGAIVTVTFKNLRVNRISDNKAITINGTHTITNVSGGLLVNLSSLRTIMHSITSSNMSITFDDGSERSWQLARERTFTYNNGIVITTRGTHIDGTNRNIEEWGTTRYGHAFVSSITDPMVIRQDCSFRLTSGSMKMESLLATTVATFGLDVTGKATGCPATGTYYFKADWTGVTGKTLSVILPY